MNPRRRARRGVWSGVFLLAGPAAAEAPFAWPQMREFLAPIEAPRAPAIHAGSPELSDVEIPFGSLIQAPDSESVRRAAEADPGLRLIVDKARRELRLMRGSDTLFSGPVAIGSGKSFTSRGRRFTFATPIGKRVILAKQRDPLWTPPDWHYLETAAQRGLEAVFLEKDRPVELSNGRRLEIRGAEVGVVDASGEWRPMLEGEHIVFDGKLFAPPLGTANRRIAGILGPFKLDMGDGFLIHGTNPSNAASIGRAASHGCVRLANDRLAELYPLVPSGTPVYIY